MHYGAPAAGSVNMGAETAHGEDGSGWARCCIRAAMAGRVRRRVGDVQPRGDRVAVRGAGHVSVAPVGPRRRRRHRPLADRGGMAPRPRPGRDLRGQLRTAPRRRRRGHRHRDQPLLHGRHQGRARPGVLEPVGAPVRRRRPVLGVHRVVHEGSAHGHVMKGGRFRLKAIAVALFACLAAILPGQAGPAGAVGTLSPRAGGRWILTGSPAIGLKLQTATLLPNGTVLVAGGQNYAPDDAELYYPSAGQFGITGGMVYGGRQITATKLRTGRVLGAGGYTGTNTAELYDPSTGAWGATAWMHARRYAHTATLLPDGRVLVTGGYNYFDTPIPTAELYLPNKGRWKYTGDMAQARGGHQAVLLPNGKVLVAGGRGQHGGLPDAELYDPATGKWSPTGSMTQGRY